jgi:hypothetical protein
MIVSAIPGALKKFRRTSWRLQQTVERPPAVELDKFVSTFLQAQQRIKAATLTIDAVIFNAERLTALCAAGSALTHDSSIFGGVRRGITSFAGRCLPGWTGLYLHPNAEIFRLLRRS